MRSSPASHGPGPGGGRWTAGGGFCPGRCAGGRGDRNEEAIAQTQQRYGGYLYKIAFQVLASRPDSEESVNDTYLKAWGSMPPHQVSTAFSQLREAGRRGSWTSRSSHQALEAT